MKSLSVVIFYSKDFFFKNMEVLNKKFLTPDTELIVLSNENITEPIPFKHEKRTFKNTKDFKKNIIASCSSTKIILIDSGIILTENFTNFILDHLNENTCFNVSATIKSSISAANKEELYLHEEIILFNKGIKGFNIHYDHEELIDYSFITCNIKNLAIYINNFLDHYCYKELYSYLSNYLTDLSPKEKALCYTTLEKIKEENPLLPWATFEDLFIKSNGTSKYTDYLLARKACGTSTEPLDFTCKILSSLTSSDYYCSWLLKDLILLPKNSLAFIGYIPEAAMEKYIIYLLENDGNCWNYLNTFISKETLHLMELKERFNFFQRNSRTIKKQISAFIKLIIITLKYMDSHITTPNRKEILLSIFSNYLTLGDKLIQLNFFPTASSIINIKAQRKLICAVNAALKFNIKARLSALTDLCKERANPINTLRYYIQNLRYEKQEFLKPLSICLITKDEEKNINRCLTSLKPLLDSNLAELIVVDTGSTDNTINIAKTFTNKVYFHKWENNFSTARNQSLMYADGQYSFILDADEEISKKAIDLIIAEFSKEDYKNYATLTLNIMSYTDTALKYYAVMPQPRIFKNDCIFYYSSSVHNQPVCSPPVKNLDIDILHYGYIMTPDIKEKKYKRTVTLLKKELETNPGNVYFNYQLSSSYAMYGDMKNALKQVELYLQLISESDELYDSVLMYYNNAAAIYINCFIYDKAERVCDKALEIAPDFIDFNYYKGFILFENKDYKNALPYLEAYLSLISNYSEIQVSNDGRFAFYTLCSHEEVKKLLLQTHYSLGMYEECIQDIYILEDETMIINCLYEFISSCLKEGNITALNDFYTAFASKSENETFMACFKYFKDLLEGKAFFEDFYNLQGYSFDSLNFESFYPFIDSILEEVLTLNEEKLSAKEELLKYKKILQLIIHRTEDLRYYYLSEEELIDLFNKYMFICSRFTSKADINALEPREIMFINKMLQGYKGKTKAEATELFHHAIVEYPLMKGIVDLTIEILFDAPCDEDNLVENKEPGKEGTEVAITDKAVANFIDSFTLQKEGSTPITNMRILHGTMDNTEATTLIVNGLKKKNLYAHSLNYIPGKCCCTSDYEMDVNSFENGQIILNRTLEATLYLIPRYDIFHFYHGTSLNFSHEDIGLIKKLNKKIVVQLCGEELRTSLKASELSPELNLDPEKDQEIERKLSEYSKYADCCIVDDYESYEYAKCYFDYVEVVAPFVRPEPVMEATSGEKFKIVHCPINPNLSGTDYITKAVAELKEFYDFDFVIVDNQPIEKVKEAFKGAHLIIDGLLIGAYSKYAIEAMALSKPVMSYISDFMEDRYPSDLPILKTTKTTLKEDMEAVLKDKGSLTTVGVEGLAYVTKYHNESTEISKLIEVYKNISS